MRGFPAVGGGAAAVAHRSQGSNSPAALTGTRQEVQEKTVYIYMTHQHFGEVCTWTSEASVTDLSSPSSSTASLIFADFSATVRAVQNIS